VVVAGPAPWLLYPAELKVSRFAAQGRIARDEMLQTRMDTAFRDVIEDLLGAARPIGDLDRAGDGRGVRAAARRDCALQ
jgi:hypothetical protein